jgi:hypothetical protein
MVPDPVPVDQDRDQKIRRPGRHLNADVDDRADDVSGQHEDDDAVDVSERAHIGRLLEQERHPGDRREAAFLATAGEFRRLDENPVGRIVELIGGDGPYFLVGRQRRPTDPLRTRAPDHPAGTNLAARDPHPAELIVMRPSALVVDDRAPFGSIVEIPAITLRLHPMARRVGMPARRGDGRHPYLAVGRMGDEAPIAGEHGALGGIERVGRRGGLGLLGRGRLCAIVRRRRRETGDQHEEKQNGSGGRARGHRLDLAPHGHFLH